MTVTSGSALGRLLRSTGAEAGESCELCSEPLPPEHRHVLDLSDGDLRCACRACALLFEREAAARGHYRLVPEGSERLPTADVDVGVPVGLVFFVVQPDGSVLARYPSPMGATTWDVDPELWSSLVARWPRLADLVPAVEALLVNTSRGAKEYWVVPVDVCFRLVALIRQHWTGLSGGREVWPAVDRFFAGLAGTTARTSTGTT